MLKWRSDLAGKPLSHFIFVAGNKDRDKFDSIVVWAATYKHTEDYALLADDTLFVGYIGRNRIVRDVKAIAKELMAIDILKPENDSARAALPELFLRALP